MQMQEDVAPPSPSHIRWMKVVSFLQLVFVGPAGACANNKVPENE